MLLANQCAAHFARVKQIPFVYRVHEEPNAEKLERLHALLQACGSLPLCFRIIFGIFFVQKNHMTSGDPFFFI